MICKPFSSSIYQDMKKVSTEIDIMYHIIQHNFIHINFCHSAACPLLRPRANSTRSDSPDLPPSRHRAGDGGRSLLAPSSTSPGLRTDATTP